MQKLKEIFSWIWPVLLGLLITLVIKQFWFTIVRVDGVSMYPNLQNNERIVEFHHSQIKHDSVIVFDAYGVDKRPSVQKNTKYVKRVIGLPGDKIEYKNNGKLYVNGKLTSQSYISKDQQGSGTITLQLQPAKGVTLGDNKTFTVPKNKYFVLGDNREVSNDSRYYGFVPRNKIDGVAKVPFWNSKADLINSFDKNK